MMLNYNYKLSSMKVFVVFKFQIEMYFSNTFMYYVYIGEAKVRTSVSVFLYEVKAAPIACINTSYLLDRSVVL